MTTLRKKIFTSKIQKIISQNSFVLFFQFNNIKFKDWILLKNQIFHLKSINVIVIKNKIPHENLFAIKTENKISPVVHHSEFLSKENFNKKFSKHQTNLLNQSKVDLNCSNEKNLVFHLFDKKKLGFLCQGPTLMIAFNSIKHCKAIYEILNMFTYNFSYNKLQFKNEFLDSYKREISCLHNTNLPSLFIKKKNTLQLQASASAKRYLQKPNFANKKNIKFSFFFIGGLVQGKTINYLDFEKLLQLNNSVYTHLIIQYSSGIVWLMFFNIILKIKLMKCFQINLINVLSIRKNNLKKISN